MKSIRVMGRNQVLVDLTSPQTTGMGMILHKMYYNTQIAEVLGDMCTGYPHNGGSHTLRLKGPYQDVIAAIEMIRDETPIAFHPMVTEAKMELTKICKQIKDSVEIKK